MTVSGSAGTPTEGVGGIEVVRSEEQVRAGVTRHVSGRVRVGKRVVSEERTVTVTVRREELYVEELGAGDVGRGDASAAGAGDREIVLTLRQEVPVVSMQLEGVEVVRVRVVRTTENVVASAEVAREVIDVTGVDESPRRP